MTRNIALVGALLCFQFSAAAFQAVNGGFETGDFQGWSVLGNASVGGTTFGTVPPQGSYQALLQASSSVTPAQAIQFTGGPRASCSDILGQATASTFIQQPMNGSSTLSFRVKFFANATSSGLGSGLIAYWTSNSSNKCNYTVVVSSNSPLVTFPYVFGYGLITLPGFGSTEAGTISIGLVTNGNPQDSAALIDDVQISPTLTSTSVPQIVDGAGWTTRFAIINTDQVPITFSFQFSSDNGFALPFPILSGAPGVLSGTLAPGASYFAQSPGTSSTLQQGWAQVTSSGKIGVTAFLQFRIGSPRDSLGSEIATQSGNSILMPFDNTLGNVTAIAIANTNPSQALNVAMQFATDSGVQSNASIILQPLAHQAVVLPIFNPAVAGFRGSVHFTAPTPDIAVMGLEFTSAGAFSSLGAFQ